VGFFLGIHESALLTGDLPFDPGHRSLRLLHGPERPAQPFLPPSQGRTLFAQTSAELLTALLFARVGNGLRTDDATTGFGHVSPR
jgi:hypothetical protein